MTSRNRSGGARAPRANTNTELRTWLRLLFDGLPGAVDEWFTRCFHMDVNQRFQTAAEMNQAWQMAITAPPAKAPSEQGFPMWAIVTLLALGVLTVFGALYFLI